MGRLKKGDKPRIRANYKFPQGLADVMLKAREWAKYTTETDFVIDAIKEKSVKILGNTEVKKIMNDAI